MAISDDLIEASKQGALERVKEILDTDAGLANGRDESGATPLHYAALNGHRPVVQTLVERGADINSLGQPLSGATPTRLGDRILRYMPRDGRPFGNRTGRRRLRHAVWATRAGSIDFSERFFPALRHACAAQGTPFQQLAQESGNKDIMALFDL